MLIPCPECNEQVSDRAAWCPRCGFPVAAEVNRSLLEVTGAGSSRSARQQAAKENLEHWAQRYGPSMGRGLSDDVDGFLDRNRKIVIFAVVALVVALQLAFLLSAVN